MPIDLDAALSAPWLAARLAVDPVALDIRRRSGELFAVRPSGSPDWLYPSWQFDEEWRLRPQVQRVLVEARDAQMRQAELEQLLQRRVGLAGRRTLLALLVEGDDAAVVSAIKAERERRP